MSTSLFEGSPITASTSSQSTTQTPQWMQDAIYNQVQLAQNVAAIPFEQYAGQMVAGPTQNQRTGWNQLAATTNAWRPTLGTAQQGLQSLTQQPGGYQVGSQYINQALQGGPAGSAAAQPWLNQAFSSAGGANAAQPWLNQAFANSGGNAAQPWLNRAGQTSVAGINQYMNPYNQQVTDRIAQLGARNLSENLLPSIGDQFVKAGQFGGSRMGEFASRALRDTQDSILGQQAQALQQGYGQALGASQSDLARQLQIGQTAGQFGNEQQQNLLNAAQLAGGYGNQQQQALLNAAQLMGGYGQNYQQQQLNAGQTLAGLQNQDVATRGNLYNALANTAQQQQTQNIAGSQALQQAGEQQRQIQQSGLDALYNQYLRQQAYPQQQTAWLTQQLQGLNPMVPSVTSQTGVQPTGSYNPSQASTISGALAALLGLQNS